MRNDGLLTREVVSARAEADARSLGTLLVTEAVGAIVIVDEERRPVGIVTDRDLTCRVIAEGRDPAKTTARDVMSAPVTTARVDERIEDLLERMRAAAIRRLPVVDAAGRVVGIVSLDDLVVHLGRELDDLAEAARREIFDARVEARWERRRVAAEEALRDLLERLEGTTGEARKVLSEEIEALRERLRRLGD